MTAARILTVRQPWAWAIIHGGKTVENRVRNIAGDYRGPVLIHAAQQVDLAAFSGQSAPLTAAVTAYNEANTDVLKSGPWHAHRGAIIGVVDLVAVHHWANCLNPTNPGDETTWSACSPWAETLDAHHLVLKNPRALDEPIPYKGALGLRRSPFNVADDWLLETVDRCTCGLHIAGAHEAHCGIEAVARLVATS